MSATIESITIHGEHVTLTQSAGGRWLASCDDLGCWEYGESREEALKKLREAMEILFGL